MLDASSIENAAFKKIKTIQCSYLILVQHRDSTCTNALMMIVFVLIPIYFSEQWRFVKYYYLYYWFLNNLHLWCIMTCSVFIDCMRVSCCFAEALSSKDCVMIQCVVNSGKTWLLFYSSIRLHWPDKVWQQRALRCVFVGLILTLHSFQNTLARVWSQFWKRGRGLQRKDARQHFLKVSLLHMLQVLAILITINYV